MAGTNTMARLAVLLVVIAVIAPAAGVVAAAPPPPPAAYYGSLTVNGEPAPAGVTVTARIDGESRGSLTTARRGAYGGPGAFEDKLQVDGTDADDGKPVTFFVGGVRADTTVTWHAGDVRRVNLAVSGDVDLPGDGGSSGSGGGGGGGGGGGSPIGSGDGDGNETGAQSPDNTTSSDELQASVTVDRTTNETRVAVTNATANATVSVELDTDENDSDGDVTLDRLNVTTTTGGDFTLNVTLHDDPPDSTATVDEPPTDAVGYLQIDHSVPDEQIGAVEFRFRVSKTRLADRGLDPADVALYRHHDGAWTALETSPAGETGTHYVFRAVSPGLSVFAIGSRPAAADTTPTETPPATTARPTATDTRPSTPTVVRSPTVEPVGAVDDSGAPPTDADRDTTDLSTPTVVALAIAIAVALAGLVLYRRLPRRE